jgi:amino acid transporter
MRALNSRRNPRQLGLLSLICVMFLVVSGGAYGLEDAVGIGGARMALLLCAVVPFTLSLPTALMAAELTALIPAEGGFYFWVKDAFGPFAGFLEAYLTVLYSGVDMALYPVLFATYLGFVIPLGLSGQIIVGIVMVWLSGVLNLMGVRLVGDASVALTSILIAPFVVLVVAGLPRLFHCHLPAGPLVGNDFFGALGGTLSIIIWNLAGWENLSVVAAEIEQPARNYIRAVAATLPLVALGYLLPLAVSLCGASRTAQWQTGWFAEEGRRLAGPWLGAAIGIGGAVSAFAIFEAAMLWVSRLPFVLARERYLPQVLGNLWSEHETPARSILLCCFIFTLLIPLGFVTLILLDVFFYMFALILEMGALVRLRRLYSTRDGLFKIGGGRVVLWLVAAAPVATWIATFGLALAETSARRDFFIAIALAALAGPVYLALHRRYGGPPADPREPQLVRRPLRDGGL